MIDSLLGIVGVAGGAAGAVLGTFWKYEDVASPEAKVRVTHWLRYTGPMASRPGWADHLVVAFNKIFGERHFSLKCILRSCLASIVAVCIMFVAWKLLRKDEFVSFAANRVRGEGVLALVFIILAGFIINLLPDYISYMKARKILEKIAKAKSAINVLIFAVLDTVVSVLIFFSFAFLLDWLSGGAWRWNIPTLADDLVKIFTLHASAEGDPSIGIFLYAALFVSAWSWLYAVSALLTRLMVRLFPKLLTSAVWFFDVDGHPIRSLGCIAGGIVFIAVLALKLID
jgi:hypothetical protein